MDYALADDTQGTLRGFDNIVLAMGSRANSGIEETAEKTAKRVNCDWRSFQISWKCCHGCQ